MDQSVAGQRSGVLPRTICVVGAGYVGLAAAACMASLGHSVRCLEVDRERLATLSSGRVPIEEPGLAEAIAAQVRLGRLRFTADARAAMEGAPVAMLCVGTPARPDGDPDLRQLSRAARTVVEAASRDVVMVVKSTVPPGSCEAIELLALSHAAPGMAVSVVSNPEFLREGRAVQDFLDPDRVVIGVDAVELEAEVRSLYPAWWPTLVCDRRSAELIKYASNTFLAVKISFANEVAALCGALGADAADVLAGVGMDPRIGPDFLGAGPGFGGECLPKDVAGFVAVARRVGERAPVAEAALEANRRALEGVLATVERALGGLEGARVAILGIAFKPGTDDLRRSPAIELAGRLRSRGADVAMHDPLARLAESPPADGAHGATIRQAPTLDDALADADAMVVMTGWDDYRDIEPLRARRSMRGDVVVDAVSCLDLEAYEAVGLDGYGVGRGRAPRPRAVVTAPFNWAQASPA